MKTSVQTNHKNIATLIHLSTFSKYFFPFGNFILPVILWMAQRKESDFVDDHGKRAINFQISIFIYIVSLVLLSIPFFIWQGLKIAERSNGFENLERHFENPASWGDVSGLLILIVVLSILILTLFIIELFAVISAAISASNGKIYRYPLTINFIAPLPSEEKSADPASSTEEKEPVS